MPEISDEEIEAMFSSEEVPRMDLRMRHSEAKYLLELVRMDARRHNQWPWGDKWTHLIRIHLGGELARIIRELKHPPGHTKADKVKE